MESLLSTLTATLLRRVADAVQHAPHTGRQHVRATVGRKGARRSSGRVYGMNGPRAVARRKRQIERAKAKAARREREVA